MPMLAAAAHVLSSLLSYSFLLKMHFTAQGWDDLKIKTWEEQKVNGSGRSITALNGIVYSISIFIQYYMALVPTSTQLKSEYG